MSPNNQVYKTLPFEPDLDPHTRLNRVEQHDLKEWWRLGGPVDDRMADILRTRITELCGEIDALRAEMSVYELFD